MQPSLVYSLSFVLAACSLVYELVLAQAVSFFAANTVVCYSVVIGIYVGAMGWGALTCRGTSDTVRDRLGGVEIRLSLWGATAVAAVHGAHMIAGYLRVHGMEAAGVSMFMAVVGIWVAAVGFLTGRELPLLLAVPASARIRPPAYRVLAADYFGSLTGALIFPLVLLPRWSLLTIGWAAALINLGAAGMIVGRHARRHLIGPAVVLVACLASADPIERYFLGKYYAYGRESGRLWSLIAPSVGGPEVRRIRSFYQRIDWVHFSWDTDSVIPVLIRAFQNPIRRASGTPHGWRLYLNGEFQIDTSYEAIYHEYLVHVPVIVSGSPPEEVLVIGAGDGLILRELLRYPKVRRICHVELDPKVIRLARSDPVLREVNGGALDDPRVDRIITDGYHFVHTTTERFDAVYVDVPIPADYNLSKLYSREFFVAVRRLLRPSGYVAFEAPWSAEFTPFGPSRQVPEEDNQWPVYERTLRAAGFKGVLPYVSHLGLRNRRAVEAVYRWLKGRWRLRGEDKDLWAAAKQTAADYAWSLQEGFVMARVEPFDGPPQYHEVGLRFSVLNAERFHRAFSLPFPKKKGRVNSIFRPALPDLKNWRLRFPY